MAASPPRPSTRTVAIILPSAVKHRLTIEPRIIEAGFEIVKERQMEWHPEGDKLLLHDLFGHVGTSMTSGPVWVYVLERKRAVEVLLTLMGNEDPELARADAPKSLRAVYGRSSEDNAIYGSPSEAVAERQISVLFASSPPFRALDIPLPTSESYLALDIASPETPARPKYHDITVNTVTPGSSVSSPASGKPTSSKSPFKARPVPSTIAVPTSQPRPNRASALRLGLDLPPPAERPKRVPSAEADAITFADVPGHKHRSSIITVASCAPPASAPRQTKASALRTGQVQDPTPVRERKPVNFEGTPGHKRSGSFAVASIKPPTMVPRLNRSATLRAQGGLAGAAAPPSSFRARSATQVDLASTGKTTSSSRPLLARPASTTNLLPSHPSPSRATSSAAPPSSFRAPASASSATNNTPSRPSTATGSRPSLSTRSSTSSLASSNATPTPADRPRPVSALLRPPSITPRTNRSALLRASMGGVGGPVVPKGLASPPKPKATKKPEGGARVIAV